MSKKWDGTEFFQMMADNEKAVGALYRKLAGDAKLGGQFYEKLAKDEDNHYVLYTALLKRFASSKGLTVEVTEDQEKYLGLLIKNNALRDTDKLLERVSKMTDKDEVYGLAEAAERDAVLFVEELIGLYPDLQPEEFQTVLKEEKNHLKQVMTRRMESKLTTLRL